MALRRTAKAVPGQLDLLHESVVRAGRDGERRGANRVRAAPTELLSAIVATSNRSKYRALGGDRQARRLFAGRNTTDGFGGRMQRRGAPRQEHGDLEP